MYIYDAKGSPIGMQYRTSSYPEDVWDVYWFDKNLQGDIVAVYSYNGTLLISYKYDAWGNTTTTYSGSDASTTAVNNSLTYRGYYYDKDLGLYYLQSRYYDPVVKRFINADSVGYLGVDGSILSYNLFIYCGNNPVMLTDSTGNWHIWDSIKEFFEETFGAGIIKSNSYETASVETFFGGTETGTSTSEVILGDVSKPISVFVTTSSEWWKFWEYKAGVQININDGGVALAFGLGESSITVSNGNTSIEFMGGINKVGCTVSYDVDFGNRTAGTYHHSYVRTIPLVGAAVLVYATYGAVLPALQPALAR